MSFKIIRPDPNSLIISESRLSSALSTIYSIGFFTIWYTGLLSFGDSEKDIGMVDRVLNLFSMSPLLLWERIQTMVTELPFLLIFLLAPLLWVPSIIRSIRRILFGDNLLFDGQSHLLSCNGKEIANFSEIEKIEMETDKSEGSKTWSLSARLKHSEKTIPIVGKNSTFSSKKNQKFMHDLGEEIAKITISEFVENPEKTDKKKYYFRDIVKYPINYCGYLPIITSS